MYNFFFNIWSRTGLSWAGKWHYWFIVGDWCNSPAFNGRVGSWRCTLGAAVGPRCTFGGRARITVTRTHLLRVVWECSIAVVDRAQVDLHKRSGQSFTDWLWRRPKLHNWSRTCVNDPLITSNDCQLLCVVSLFDNVLDNIGLQCRPSEKVPVYLNYISNCDIVYYITPSTLEIFYFFEWSGAEREKIKYRECTRCNIETILQSDMFLYPTTPSFIGIYRKNIIFHWNW